MLCQHVYFEYSTICVSNEYCRLRFGASCCSYFTKHYTLAIMGWLFWIVLVWYVVCPMAKCSFVCVCCYWFPVDFITNFYVLLVVYFYIYMDLFSFLDFFPGHSVFICNLLLVFLFCLLICFPLRPIRHVICCCSWCVVLFLFFA